MSKLEKRLGVALSISVALNLFFAGFVVARRLGQREPPWREQGALEVDAPRHVMRALRHAGGGEHARRALEAHRDEMRAEHRAMREARRAAAAALAAEPFDRAAVERALETVRARVADSQRTAHAVVVEVAAELPPQERARLLSGPARRGGPHGGPGGPGRPWRH